MGGEWEWRKGSTWAGILICLADMVLPCHILYIVMILLHVKHIKVPHDYMKFFPLFLLTITTMHHHLFLYRPRKFEGRINRGGHLAIKYGGELLYLFVQPA